jgi:hypothetical protein
MLSHLLYNEGHALDVLTWLRVVLQLAVSNADGHHAADIHDSPPAPRCDGEQAMQ